MRVHEHGLALAVAPVAAIRAATGPVTPVATVATITTVTPIGAFTTVAITVAIAVTVVLFLVAVTVILFLIALTRSLFTTRPTTAVVFDLSRRHLAFIVALARAAAFAAVTVLTPVTGAVIVRRCATIGGNCSGSCSGSGRIFRRWRGVRVIFDP